MIGQFVVPNRRAIEEPKEVLTFNLCQFFDRAYNKWGHLYIGCTKPILNMHVSLSIGNKTIL